MDSSQATSNNLVELASKLDGSLIMLSKEMSRLVGNVDQLLYSTGKSISKEKFQISDLPKMKELMGDIVQKSRKIFDENW